MNETDNSNMVCITKSELNYYIRMEIKFKEQGLKLEPIHEDISNEIENTNNQEGSLELPNPSSSNGDEQKSSGESSRPIYSKEMNQRLSSEWATHRTTSPEYKITSSSENEAAKHQSESYSGALTKHPSSYEHKGPVSYDKTPFKASSSNEIKYSSRQSSWEQRHKEPRDKPDVVHRPSHTPSWSEKERPGTYSREKSGHSKSSQNSGFSSKNANFNLGCSHTMAFLRTPSSHPTKIWQLH